MPTPPEQAGTPRDQTVDGLDLNPGGQKGRDPRRNPGGQMGQGRPGEQASPSTEPPEPPTDGTKQG